MTSGPALSARRKLGNVEFLRCALLNPPLLNNYGEVVRRAYDAGHEIGLHGGRNHEHWARFADQWDDDRIRLEIEWGIEQLKTIGIRPQIFASPGAVGGERVRQIISTFSEFSFISDQLKPDRYRPEPVSSGVQDIPVAICGVGGVAFVEQQVALNRDIQQATEEFRIRLRKFPVQVVYDHPYFAGAEALPYTAHLIDVALEEGFKFVSMKTIGESLAAAI